MWISCVFYVLCLSSFHICSLLPCCHLLGKKADLLALVGDVYCIFVTFPCGILGQVWYLIVFIPDHCRLSFFYAFIYLNECLLSEREKERVREREREREGEIDRKADGHTYRKRDK